MKFIKVIISIWIVMNLFTSSILYAEDLNVHEVVAKGLGTNPDSALKNALMNSVQQTIGTVVEAETLVKNDEIIKDLILTYSDGYVNKFEKVDETQRDDGLYEVTIKALVQKRQLVQKLKESNIAVKNIDGESIFAEVYTKEESKKDAKSLLENTLKGIPYNVLGVDIVESKPEIVKQSKDGITGRWKIRLYFDLERYYDQLVPNLEKCLDNIAINKSNDAVNIQWADRGLQIPGTSRFAWRGPGGIGSTDVLSQLIRNHRDNKVMFKDSLVLLNVGSNIKGDNQQWKWFVLDSVYSIPLFDEAARRKYIIRVGFYNSENKCLRTNDIMFTPFKVGFNDSVYKDCIEEFPPDNFERIVHSSLISSDLKKMFSANIKSNLVVISPLFGSYQGVLSDTIILNVEYDFTLDEIKNISKIKTSIIDPGKSLLSN